MANAVQNDNDRPIIYNDTKHTNLGGDFDGDFLFVTFLTAFLFTFASFGFLLVDLLKMSLFFGQNFFLATSGFILFTSASGEREEYSKIWSMS